MATRNLAVTLKVRQDTATNWTAKNPVLASGEFGFDTTNKILKLGDGVTDWGGLAAIQFEGEDGTSIAVYAFSSQEAEKAVGYSRGGELDNELKQIKARLRVLEGGN